MKTILQAHVPHNTGWSGEMKHGQVIRITATTTVDFVFFRLQNLRERFDQPRTKDRKSTRLNSSHIQKSRMPSSA